MSNILGFVLTITLFGGAFGADIGQDFRQPAKMQLPPPPIDSPEANDAYFRFDRAKTVQENTLARQAIATKLEYWVQRLKQLERQQRKLGILESNTPSSTTQGGMEAREFMAAKAAVAENIRAWQKRMSVYELESICGPNDDSKDVELYDGSLGPTTAFVQGHQASTAQIQWNNNLRSIFNAPGDDPGNVNDVRWCTGTLISEKLFITAGHCFDIDSNGWRTPRRNSGVGASPVAAKELAALMHVNFNYQINGVTRQTRTPDVYPIVSLLEYRLGNLDYAVVELGLGPEGEFPSKRYAIQSFDTSQAALLGATSLTVIQHPNGQEKKISAGSGVKVGDRRIAYSDVDTLGGSSGSGVIDQAGRLIGVHTNGGCTINGGENFGVPLNAIRNFSNLIR